MKNLLAIGVGLVVGCLFFSGVVYARILQPILNEPSSSRSTQGPGTRPTQSIQTQKSVCCHIIAFKKIDDGNSILLKPPCPKGSTGIPRSFCNKLNKPNSDDTHPFNKPKPNKPNSDDSTPSTVGYPAKTEKCPPPVRVTSDEPPLPDDFICSASGRWGGHCNGKVVYVSGEVRLSVSKPRFICRVSFGGVYCQGSGYHPRSDLVELRKTSSGNWPMCENV